MGGRSWTTKPPPSVRFAPPRRLRDGLVSFWELRESVGLGFDTLRDSVGENHLACNSVTWEPGTRGAPGIRVPTFGFARKVSPVGLAPAALSVVVWCSLNQASSVQFDRITATNQFGTAGGWMMYMVEATTKPTAFVGNGTTSLAVQSAYSMPIFGPACAGFTYDGTTLTVYADGLPAGSVGGGFGTVSAPTPFLLGGGSDTSHPFKGITDQAGVWSRVLSPEEMLLIARDPFVFYAPREHAWAYVEPLAPTPVFPLDGNEAASPVVFVWRSALQPNGRAVHFRVQVDPAAEAFDPADYERASADDATGFEYDTSTGNDGSGPWDALPSSGLAAADQGRRVRVSQTLTAGTYRWRVRQEPV